MQNSRWGVILMNLGTPKAPDEASVRQFLKVFLHDHRVVETPRVIWCPVLHGIILPLRPKKVALAYQKVWMEEGSPLEVITRRQVEALQQKLLSMSKEKAAGECEETAVIPVTYAMTYGSPSFDQAVEKLSGEGVERMLVLPLYPQYSATTTGAIYDQYAKLIKRKRNIPDIIINKHYYQRPDYIEALASSIERVWRKVGRSQKLLLSYHGIPQRYVDLGDPYYDHCEKTSQLLARRLKLSGDEWAMSFQSRLGAAKWLQPYTDKLLTSWARSGVSSVDVACPAFSTDCLETLEEIDKENRQLFLDAGGQTFVFIPCLNDDDLHITMLASLVKDYTG